MNIEFSPFPISPLLPSHVKVWKLSSTDLCEIARNGVLHSGFPHACKKVRLQPPRPCSLESVPQLEIHISIHVFTKSTTGGVNPFNPGPQQTSHIPCFAHVLEDYSHIPFLAHVMPLALGIGGLLAKGT